MSAILGGLFNSRLNMNLREEKGYTYGASAGFDLRRAPRPVHRPGRRQHRGHGPGAPRVPRRARPDPRGARSPTPSSRAARDFLVGVFPLRFETPGPVAGSLAGLFVHDLPDDELARYRAAIEAVTAADVQRVAREHIRPEAAAIVLVGDHDAVRRGARRRERLGPVDGDRGQPRADVRPAGARRCAAARTP